MSAIDAYHVRWSTKKDSRAIMRINADKFSVMSEDDLFTSMRQSNVFCMVAEEPEGMVVGFTIYRIRVHDLEILNFVVGGDYRRRGVGTALMAKLMSKLGNVRNRLYADVPDTHLDFHYFLRACGVLAVGLVRGKDYDVYEFAYKFFEPAAAGVEA